MFAPDKTLFGQLRGDLVLGSPAGFVRLGTKARGSAAIALVALVFEAERADAQERASTDIDARYRAIESAFARGEGSFRLWWTGWTLGYAGLTAAQATIALVADDEGRRIDAVVGGAGSLLGLGGMLITTRVPFTARSTLAEMDAGSVKARALRLREAESLLETAADAERFQRSIWAQLGAVTVTLAQTFTLWIGYRRYASGWINLFASTVISEAQILTLPTDAIEAWDAYRAGRLRASAVASRSVLVTPSPSGLALSGVF